VYLVRWPAPPQRTDYIPQDGKPQVASPVNRGDFRENAVACA
jgi:hypothetical protein